MTTPLPEPESSERTMLIESCQGLVRNLAWQIHQRIRGRMDLDDLIAYGQLGLVKAADKYETDRGTRFTTYAYQCIRGAILDGMSQMGWFRRADFHAGRYQRLADELLGEAGALQGGETLDQDAGWMHDLTVRLSIVYLASGMGGEEGRPLVLEDTGAEQPGAALGLEELRCGVRAAIEALPEQARGIIQLMYFEGLSLTAASERLQISKSWASRLHDRTLRNLAMALRQSGVEKAA